MANIVTLGELMMRLSTPRHERFLQANHFEITFGGGEANVAVCLAQLGHTATFVTKLPQNPLGDKVIASLRATGVDTERIVRGGKRLGVYFLETGAAMRPSSVIYDRADSAIAEAEVSDFDFEKIFHGADIFHVCGITPGISKKGALLAEAAMKAAKEQGVTVSFDINFRSKLWTKEQAAEVLPRLVPYADICFGNAWDAKNLLHLPIDENADFETGAKAMADAFGLSYVIASHRVSHSASHNDLSASIYAAKEDKVYTSRTYSITPIVDRVGGGDSLAAGVLCGIADGKACAEVIEFGVATSALKHTIHSDYNMITRAEVETLMQGDGSGKVQR